MMSIEGDDLYPSSVKMRFPIFIFFKDLRHVFKLDELGSEIAQIALPAALALTADPIASLVDTAFIGQIGSVELAAVGVSIALFNQVSRIAIFPLVSITTSFVAEEDTIGRVTSEAKESDCMETGSCVDTEKNVLIPQKESTDGPYWPKTLESSFDIVKSEPERRHIPSASSALVIGAILGLLQAIFLISGAKPLLNFMGIGSDSPMLNPAQQYLTLRSLGAPAVLLSLAMQGIFRGFKDTKTPLYATVAGDVTNIILDPIFMFVFHLGVSGAAIAHVISQYLIAVILLWKLMSQVDLLPPSLKHLQFGGFLKNAVIKFFPHQVSDLELAVSLLEKCHHTSSVSSLRQESTGEMETKCVMLLWLSILVLVPFDISSVDSSIVNSSIGGEDELAPLVLRIIGFSKDYLSNAGPMRTMAGLVLSKLLTRPDMPKALSSFIEWTHEVLSSTANDAAGSREVLLDVAPIWNDVSVLIKSGSAARSPMLRKYLKKLTQRIGLTCLPHRLPTWRYVGRTTSLGENISMSASNKNNQLNHGMNLDNCESEENSNSPQDEDMDVPEIVEEVIEVLLSGLKDTDTVVRWSAAKGIGRVTSRLTSELSEEVLSSVLELFAPGEGDGSWHGGCLALAELARRGLLLPFSLPKVVPVVIKVNCRRAAAAAFQENVGRQGNYPHGIDIVNTADYFSLSSRSNSYIHVAISIAQYEGYLHSFAEELLHNKICHWDRSLRELAAEALAALVRYDAAYFADFVLEKLIPFTLSSDLCTRHGATLAAGELVLALHQCGRDLSNEKQRRVSGIVPAIEKTRLYRGEGRRNNASSCFLVC